MIINFKGLSKYDYILCMDIEHDKGKLIQFAGLLYKQIETDNFQLVTSMNMYINQDILSEFIQSFTGITQEFMNTYGSSIDECIDTIFNKLLVNTEPNKTLIVSHGVHQDCIILEQNGIDLSEYDHACTLKMAQQVLKRTHDLSLNDISNEFGLGLCNLHNAYIDALATAMTLSSLCYTRQEDK